MLQPSWAVGRAGHGRGSDEDEFDCRCKIEDAIERKIRETVDAYLHATGFARHKAMAVRVSDSYMLTVRTAKLPLRKAYRS